MANSPSSSRPTSARGNTPGDGGRRKPPPQVKKPFPWGVVAISTVLGLLLAGILVYAVQNQGAGFVDQMKKADGLNGVVVTSKKEIGDTGHTESPVDYGTTQPPVGGKMASGTAPCTVSTTPVKTELAVHSMEHGGVWVTYRPDLPKDQIAALTDAVGGKRLVLLSPFPGLDSPVSAQAWGRRLKLAKVDDPRLKTFIDGYAGGKQAPEGGAGC